MTLRKTSNKLMKVLVLQTFITLPVDNLNDEYGIQKRTNLHFKIQPDSNITHMFTDGRILNRSELSPFLEINILSKYDVYFADWTKQKTTVCSGRDFILYPTLS